jgi:hypothetical protein
MRRALAVIIFAFAPLRRTGGVLSWWPTVVAVLAAVGAVVGITVPQHVGGLWLAFAGVVVLSGLLFVAAYRLHGLALPDFPRHKLEVGPPWVMDNPDDDALSGDERLLMLNVTFYNRDPQRRVNLTLDVLWTRVVGKQSLGPYTLSYFRADALGRLALFPRKADVGPQKHVEGMAVFSAWVPGVTFGKEGSDFEAPEHLLFQIRLTDNISGAEHVEPLEVLRPEQGADDSPAVNEP